MGCVVLVRECDLKALGFICLLRSKVTSVLDSSSVPSDQCAPAATLGRVLGPIPKPHFSNASTIPISHFHHPVTIADNRFCLPPSTSPVHCVDAVKSLGSTTSMSAVIPTSFLKRDNQTGKSAGVWFHGSSPSYIIQRAWCCISSSDGTWQFGFLGDRVDAAQRLISRSKMR